MSATLMFTILMLFATLLLTTLLLFTTALLSATHPPALFRSSRSFFFFLFIFIEDEHLCEAVSPPGDRLPLQIRCCLQYHCCLHGRHPPPPSGCIHGGLVGSNEGLSSTRKGIDDARVGFDP
ncbi:hypothetical protein T484DRAFT_2125651 [Baffinella frigidus]|nr:hypothetical protein T484DRAFT_2125651 [Cryptophyta sp. CCMP2293]